MLSRRARRLLLLVAVAACAACTAEHAFQGDSYTPDETLPVDDPTLRPDTGCDGAACADAAADVLSPPNLDEAGAPPSNVCTAARDIGTVSGDTITASLQTTGTCSEWLKLRATENDNSVFAVPMKLRISVTSDANADLYVYLDANADTVSCGVPYAVSNGVGPGESEIASVQWGESVVANRSDDSRTVNILVLFPDTVCNASTSWSLVVDGNR